MTVKIGRNSWLNKAQLLKSGDFVFWETPDFPQIQPSKNDRFVTVDSGYVGRLDLIAFDYYGDVELWWVIALANGIDLIPTDFPLGTSLRVPDKSVVDAIISRATE